MSFTDCSADTDFVSQIVKDPKAPPATLLLRGYAGRAAQEDHLRIYLDAELSRFLDVPLSAILHRHPIPPQQDPLGGEMVWVDRDAPLFRGQVGSRGVASYLEGGLNAFPTAPPSSQRSLSRRPLQAVTDTCPPPTEDATCATTLQQSTCIPPTQPGSCYSLQSPEIWRVPWDQPMALLSEETAQRCHD